MESAAPENDVDNMQADSGLQVHTRSNFTPLAVFTDGVSQGGIVDFDFTLPDDLTAYRIWAVATSDAACFGLGEGSIEAALPLTIRPSLPRFLNFGDSVELAVVVQNCATTEIHVDLAARSNCDVLALQRGGEDSRMLGCRIVMPPGSRQEIRFPAVARSAGTARFQVCGIVKTGSKSSDAASIELPVWTPATAEAFATYGHLDGSNLPEPRLALAQPVLPPKDCYSEFGGLHISVSSTILHTITDSFLYLYSYKFECCEQISSKCLAVLALYDSLHAFSGPQVPEPKEVRSWLATQLDRLQKWQLPTGGFGWWMLVIPQTSPWLTLHATHVLVRAKLKGVAVNDRVLKNALSCCDNIERYLHYNCSDTCRFSVVAQALMIRSLAGADNPSTMSGKVDALLKRLGGPAGKASNLETVAFALVAANYAKNTAAIGSLVKHLENAAHETAETAMFPTSYGDDHEAKLFMLHTNRRTDAIVLMALTMATPENPLVVKAMKGLFAHQKKGRWNNTQENVWALLAVDAYFQAIEKVPPEFVARVMVVREVSDVQVEGWTAVDDWAVPSATLAVDHTFRGRNTDRAEAEVPMSFLKQHKADSGTALALVAREKPGCPGDPGTGRLYYRLGLSYAPTDLKLPELSVGFQVSRQYEAVETPSDVQKIEGVWHVKAGSMIKVTLTMTVTARRYHVALVDKMPAGFEALNPALKGEAPAAAEQKPVKRRCWWSRPWFEHQNLRDERVEAFSSLVHPGHHTYSYTARATSLGSFVAPPATAEEMYSPEIFGRTASTKVIVVP